MKKESIVSGFIALTLSLGLTGFNPSLVKACKTGTEKGCGPGKVASLSSCSLLGNSLPCPCFLLKKSDELKLTARQQGDLKTIKLAIQKEVISNYAQVKILKLELQNVLEQKTVDTKKADRFIGRIAEYLADTAKDCLVARLKARQLLTESQSKLAGKLAAVCQTNRCGISKAKCANQGIPGSSPFLQVGDLTK
ncbi:MAG: hypothetical protein ACE5GM_11005 [bacterium]